MEFLKCSPKWTRQPKQAEISESKVVIITEKGTDLWARTYYGFQNDNAPVFQIETDDKFFSFIVKTEFESSCRFDQCGVVMYLDSDNWFKASIEYEDEKIQRLGSVVTAITVSNIVKTARLSGRCGSFICGKVLKRSPTVSTPAVPQRVLIEQRSLICRLPNVNGSLMPTGV